MKTMSIAIALGATFAFALGCIPTGDAPARGAAEFTIVGSASVLSGVPRTADGWSLTFDRTLVILSYFGFQKTFPAAGNYYGDSCNYSVDSPPSAIYSLHTAATISYRGFDAGPCAGVSFELGNYDEQGTGFGGLPFYVQPGVTPDDLDAMSAADAAALVEGSAQRGDQLVHFSLALALPPNGNFARGFDRCFGTVDGARRNGLEIPSFYRDAVLLEFHAERLFRSHLPSADHTSDDDTLELDAFAAAATERGNRDGTVTIDEIKDVALASLGDATGRYDAGGRSAATQLSDFVQLQFDDIWSFRGDGHCDASH